MNFGTILHSMTKNCVKMVVENNSSEAKSAAKDFVRYVNLKEVLKKQFHVYHNLTTSYIKDVDDAKFFINETLDTLNGICFNDIKAYNAVLETRFMVKKEQTSETNKAIANLIKYKTSDVGSNQMQYIKDFNVILAGLMEIKKQEDPISVLGEKDSHSSLRFLSPKHVVRIAINKFNSDFSSKMNESDRKLFFLLKGKDKKDINEYHKSLVLNLKEECGKLSLDDKDLINNVKKAIDEVSKVQSNENILNAYELYNELKDLNNG